MTFIQGFCLIGVITGVYLGIQFITVGRKSSNTNYYLGLFFLLIAFRIGKLLIQEMGSETIQSIYFNVMHASYLALGPVTWLYIRSYRSSPQGMVNNMFHFIPSMVLLITAFPARQLLGESVWIIFYWIIQLHPLLYVISAWKFLKQSVHSNRPPVNQLIWLKSIIGSVLVIATMNVSYFIFHFPFYLVTSSLLILTSYLIISLAFSGKQNVVIGKNDKKYKNLRVSSEEIHAIWNNAKELLSKKELFLNEALKLAHVSRQLNTPPHVLSMVINTCSGKNFTDYINSMRIEKAQQKLFEERNKKILTIALESGFSSLSAFNKAFKKKTGLNPSEYRSKSL